MAEHSDYGDAVPDGSTIWSVQRVVKRFRNGPEGSIVFYGTALGLTDASAGAAAGFRRRR
ncbi:hypothetical protein ACIGMX_39265 [Streptomyces aquilus]|uniref:Uncharacterized protein n=1 Tax=Streptomyces aquilus TaxID=2548456 RepID=A0A3Q9BW54_9ACTN|nr:hypothetical protein [Streptomyces aquilus]AZP14889.1 hypothetical protein EJC51_01220 [Streptomyces aquilus]